MEVIYMYIINHINDIHVCGFGSINFELLHSICDIWPPVVLWMGWLLIGYRVSINRSDGR